MTYHVATCCNCSYDGLNLQTTWTTQDLTAPYCVVQTGKHIACDTGSPYTACLLTTRAYMAGQASRFNLTRADTKLVVFVCRGYPMVSELQPRVERATLIPMFQAQTPKKQTDPLAKGGFGDGSGCYTCHGQFATHAQLFVRFDKMGRWQATATGARDPNNELGRSSNDLFTSHFSDNSTRASESSQLFGQQVGYLADAARALVASDTLPSAWSKTYSCLFLT